MINHWTSEHDKRSLEIWSDKHPIICGLITLATLPIYAVVILFGLIAVCAMNIWEKLPWIIKSLSAVCAGMAATIFVIYWVLYLVLWTVGKLCGGDA